MDGEVDCLSDHEIGSSIKELELEWGYGVRLKGMFINKGRIYKTIRGFRVYKHRERQDIIQHQRDGGHKGFGV